MTKPPQPPPLDFQDLKPLASYVRRIPSRVAGRGISRAALWRWALYGDRHGVKLKTVLVGASRYTTDSDIIAFLERENRNASKGTGA